jgi:RNA polymerase sigma factor (sigma-70 family)
MDAKDDSELLREYATIRSETAFTSLVQRHIHFVYSSALRQVRNAHLAEEVTQAVFIILARKAGHLRQGTVLAGWLFNTARFVASAELRAIARRHKHEQEAGMESTHGETTPDVSWEQIAPFLDDGLAQLNEKDRQAVLLRFFERKTFLEVADKLGANEDAARMRVTRALKSLRGFFLKRGLTSSVTVLAAVLSANAVQAAPSGLVTAMTAGATLHGSATTTSTSSLVKGALKLMAWTKMKTGIVVGLGILLAAGTTTMTVQEISAHDWGEQTQKLADGSVLTMVSAAVEQDNKHILNISGNLKVKLKLSGAQAEDNLLVSQESLGYRPCRALISGKDGFQYENALYSFSRVGDAYWGQINTCLFPRDSAKLHIQIQQRDALEDPWKTIAEFSCRQRTGKDESWQPERTPITREVGGMQLTIGDVTLQAGPPPSQTPDQDWEVKNWQSEGWNQTVTIPWQLTKDGVIVTNWRYDGMIFRDSSGNESGVGGGDRSGTNGWMITHTWQPADPRKVWKIDMQVGQASGFEQSNVFTIRIPIHRVAPFETNVAGYPFRIQFFRDILSTELLLTNRTDLRLNFLHSEDQDGRDQSNRSLTRGQFVFQTMVDLQAGGELAETFAIGKNAEVEFMVRPRVIPGAGER